MSHAWSTSSLTARPRHRHVLLLAAGLLLLILPVEAAAQAPPAGAPVPRLMMLPFAVPPVGGIPYSAAFQGTLSREIPREIGRRMAGTIDAEVSFFAPRTTVTGRPQLVVVQELQTAEQALAIARRGSAAYVLDGVVKATDKLKFSVRLLDVTSGRLIWESVYEAPVAGAGRLLQQAARDLALALPDKRGAATADAPFPEHEPGWSTLLAYLRGEDLRFLQEQEVALRNPAPIFDAFLEAIQRDRAYDAPREALARTAWAEIAAARGPLAEPMATLDRMVVLRPDAFSYSALARAQALAGEREAAQRNWARSVEADPAYVAGWLEIAEGRLAKGEFAEAVDALSAALALGVGSPAARARVRRDLGGAYLEMGEIDDAVAALEASLKDNSGDPETQERLGRAYVAKAREPGADSKLWSDRALEAFGTSGRLRGLPEIPPP
ncbi:MAG: tetratricopeptide repeat protein [Deltaproteobacteria bacterium]|nr:tetratricopeptide repeat protein [Deltaproteobacteria bacterium]